MKLFILGAILGLADCLLYQTPTITREVHSLDGLWWFVREPRNSLGYGFTNNWPALSLSQFQNVTKMPVPSAYNDLDEDRALRDHIGWVWYETNVRLARRWNDSNTRVMLRMGSVNYHAVVFVNGAKAVEHSGGHLPFEADVTGLLTWQAANKITIACNNTLDHSTIPPGEFTYKNNTLLYPDGFFETTTDFDFFNYAGILRSVELYTTHSKQYINDVTIDTGLDGSLVVHFDVQGQGTGAVMSRVTVSSGLQEDLVVRDRVHSAQTDTATVKVKLFVRNPVLWWPLGMKHTPVAHLYKLHIKLFEPASNFTELLDDYEMEFGFRTVRVTEKELLINNEPFYCTGFGMHEDSDLRGRGYDPVVMVKDLNVLQWLGGNCFRTSHYPYAEERYVECDRRGIVIVSETPAVGARYFTEANRDTHERMLTDMIHRDKNHPCVIAWSISNEPETNKGDARDYFRHLIKVAHALDSTRPVTIVYGPTHSYDDKTADLVDLLCVNRYNGWYNSMGYLETIFQQLVVDLESWNSRFHKPLILTEYGAGAVAGINYQPGVDFSEAYQAEVLRETHRVFDYLRANQTFLVGEMVWNMADFMTQQGVKRVAGNRKGVMTRQRQPKLGAYVIRDRYWQLHSSHPHSPFDGQTPNSCTPREL